MVKMPPAKFVYSPPWVPDPLVSSRQSTSTSVPYTRFGNQMSNTETTIYSLTLSETAIANLDTLRQRFGLPSRGHVLDLAVTTAWREKVASGEHSGLWSPVTDGGRQDEILRRLHDIGRIELKSMDDVAEAAINELLTHSASAVLTPSPLKSTSGLIPSRASSVQDVSEFRM
jgi:hypothetical protein